MEQRNRDQTMPQKTEGRDGRLPFRHPRSQIGPWPLAPRLSRRQPGMSRRPTPESRRRSRRCVRQHRMARVLVRQPEDQLPRDLAHGEALPVRANHRVSVEDPPGTIRRQVPTRPTVHPMTDLATLESLPVALLGDAAEVEDQRPLELRRRAEHVQQEL